MPGVKRSLQLLKHMAARRLVGVELKAEGADADALKPLLHHLQGRRLLGNEEHSPVMAERVRDDVGDGLALAGSRRTVHDEAPPLACHRDGAELRGVRLDGNAELSGLLLPVKAPDIDRGLIATQSAAGDQRLNDRVFRDKAEVLVDVVPHHELAEREEPKEAAVLYLPARPACDLRADSREDPVDVIAALVHRELAEPLHGDAELGPEVLEKRGVDVHVLVTPAEDKGPCRLPYELHREEEKGRLTGYDALLRLIPFQGAEHDEERVGAVLVKRVAALAVEMCELRLQILSAEL